MKNTLILCKIADKVMPECCDHKSVTDFAHLQFEHNGQLWKIKEDFIGVAEQLLSVLQKCVFHRTKKICLATEFTGSNCELAIAHTPLMNKAKRIEQDMALSLFPLIFNQCEMSLQLELAEAINGTKLIKTYVTTKLYDALYLKHQNEGKNEELTKQLNLPMCFISKLRAYQERTVNWLLKREQQIDTFPNFYTKLEAKDDETKVYKHKYCIEFRRINDPPPLIKLPPGGILADEMGLGKTVELLALILLNPRRQLNDNWINRLEEQLDNLPLLKRQRIDVNLFCICASKDKHALVQCKKCQLWQHAKCVSVSVNDSGEIINAEDYICPMCWMEFTEIELIESRATIIVSPHTIKMQWYNEIHKHTKPSLRVLMYDGLNAGRWINPIQLTKYDIVLTDYNILRGEIYHTAAFKSSRITRNRPRFMRPTSPLLMINWWRVCLDEAQMVENNSSNVAEVVHMLPTINRWAVTGTPIQRSIDDLQNLLKFVGFNALCEPADTWDTLSNGFLLNKTPNNLLNLLQKCMWRTCKNKIQDELEIPEQKEIVHRLNLGNIELLYYREQHSSCASMFLIGIHKHIKHNQTSKLATLSPAILKLVLHPLLKIRQCCTIPVVQGGSKNAVAPKQFMQPKELLKHLIQVTENSCRTELRSWATSYNGIAAIKFIEKNYKEAIKNYQQVLRLAADYHDNISVDTLLQIHAIYNLLQANEFCSSIEENKIYDYLQQLKALTWKYLTPSVEALTAARIAYESNVIECEQLTKNSNNLLMNFLVKLISKADEFESAFIKKIREDCWAQGAGNEKLKNVISSRALLLVIDMWHKKLLQDKKELCKAFDQLSFFTKVACKIEELGNIQPEVVNFVTNVSDCHLAEGVKKRKASKTKSSNEIFPLCKLCQLRNIINRFECLLFDKEICKEAENTEGLERPAFEIVLIKCIFNNLKSKPAFQQYQKEFEIHMTELDRVQALSKKLIKYWIEIEYTVKTFDELDMCKMRMSLTEKEENKSIHKIMGYEVRGIHTEQLNNLNKSQKVFVRLRSRLKYLKHLGEDSAEIECPVCCSDDDDRYGILECGHTLCYTCLGRVRQYRNHKITCPLCRTESVHIYFALKKPVAATPSLNGSYSSKISYILQLVLKLRKNDPQIKILIFSQWEPILKAIATCFTENGIRHRTKCTPRTINEFKNPDLKITCLLLPYSRGSKGLNLIEATHVFLVEPTLNPGEELQAVGRVHRFGQTKTTTVHRFVVNNTIEDNIFNLITSADSNQTLSTHWELENMTLEGLQNLFTLKDANMGESD